jgi:RNA polymerase sigma-70 factor, ECF subfamily
MIAEQEAVRHTMAKLPEPLRICLLLSILGGLSTAEIANLLAIKEAAVRQRLVRARKQFQQIYAQESGEILIDATNSEHIYPQTQHGEQDPDRQHSQRTNNTGKHATIDKSQRISLTTPSPTPRSSYV